MSDEAADLFAFPCEFPIKIMGRAADGFAQAVLDVVLAHAPDFDPASMEMRASSGGNYVALTCTIRATSRAQLDALLGETRKHLPNDELLFGEDEITDRSEKFLAAEYIREKLFRLIGDELPYGAAVEIERFVVDGPLRRISAAIVVERAGHKSIVIGTGGEVVKRIASEARQDMERMFDGPVFLEVFVKVNSGWADDAQLLKSLGYE